MPRARANIAPDEVESITVSRPGMTALTGPLHPADLIDMAHSPAYFLAAGVADRDFSWAHASPAKIADPVIHRLIDKVRVGPPPTEDAARYRQGATVTIRTTDGRSVTNTVYAPKGAGAARHRLGRHRRQIPHPGAARRPAGERIEASLALIHDFRRIERVSALTELLGVANSLREAASVTAGAWNSMFSSRQHDLTADCPVVHVITGLELGGAEALLLELCREDRRRGRATVVASLLSEGPMRRRFAEIGVEVVGLGMRRGEALAAGPIPGWRG